MKRKGRSCEQENVIYKKGTFMTTSAIKVDFRRIEDPKLSRFLADARAVGEQGHAYFKDEKTTSADVNEGTSRRSSRSAGKSTLEKQETSREKLFS